ncbi:hypothetical protein QBC38DRAFT_249537 [Podospora fimiseda]|uniref:Uncharacterized protein n=1 Tax=Podospora fimiseda TaxID=252190 RepID=A0AAN7BM06_9PEZI|nr:hypothetical protein QBC38DRAFT_249537 [Podospora fimiseda]
MYFSKSTVSVLAAGSFASIAQAHMLLRTPTPYPGHQSGPLDPSGSNFPCQNVAFTGAATEMPQGSTQQLAFTGSAVHGGGSCQVSITYDNPPTANSEWKVIHSIIGGCPARNTAGNLPENPNNTDLEPYNFSIPADIPAGEATLAWTWLNKVGNREFYMNCAPVSITGSGGSEASLAALPDLFVANIATPKFNPGNQCTTPEGIDVAFPNPGSSVETLGTSPAPPAGNCGAAAAGGAAAGGAAATPAAGAAGAAATPAIRGRRVASFKA